MSATNPPQASPAAPAWPRQLAALPKDLHRAYVLLCAKGMTPQEANDLLGIRRDITWLTEPARLEAEGLMAFELQQLWQLLPARIRADVDAWEALLTETAGRFLGDGAQNRQMVKAAVRRGRDPSEVARERDRVLVQRWAPR